MDLILKYHLKNSLLPPHSFVFLVEFVVFALMRVQRALQQRLLRVQPLHVIFGLPEGFHLAVHERVLGPVLVDFVPGKVEKDFFLDDDDDRGNIRNELIQ